MSERTAVDYAIEHAEYMAVAAENLVEAVCALALAEQKLDEGEHDAEYAVESAKQDVDEHLRGVRNRVYEFRKRRNRALLSKAGGQPSCLREGEA